MGISWRLLFVVLVFAVSGLLAQMGSMGVSAFQLLAWFISWPRFSVTVFAVFVFGLSRRGSALWVVPRFSSWRGSFHGRGLSSSLRSSSASCTALVGGPLRASISFRLRVPVIDSMM